METYVAAVEFLGDVGLDLAAIVAVIANVARPFAGAIEAADMEIEIVSERRTVIEVNTVGFKVDADSALDRTTFAPTSLRDEVDYTARGVRGECGG